MLCTLLDIELLALGPPGLRSTPQAGWMGLHMASIRLHCHNNNGNNNPSYEIKQTNIRDQANQYSVLLPWRFQRHPTEKSL